MTIVGKRLTAVLFRTMGDAFGVGGYDPSIFTHRLYWTDIDEGTPDQIAGYYPSLSWDVAQRVNISLVNQFFSGVPIDTWLSNYGYADEETAILDMQNFVENIAQNTYSTGPAYAIEYLSGAWRTIGDDVYSGNPSNIWAQFPLANTYNITTPTPFGSYGNGLIQNQSLYWRNGPQSTTGPLTATPYTDSPGADTGLVTVMATDVIFIFTPLVDDSGGGGGGVTDGGGDGSTDSSVTLRCWGFSLDGHDFYVLRLGASTTLVYDITTGTWSEWTSPGRTNWRAHVGSNWVGMSSATIGRGFGTDIVAGDDATGALWVLDPIRGRDDRSDTGSDSFTRVVTGGFSVTGRTSLPCNAVQVDLALGDPTQAGATITLEYSDDFQSWVNCGPIVVNASDFNQTVEWRSLGQIGQPGRVFRIADNGATVRISGAEMR